MRLTRHTDYALRVLLYLGARPDQLCSIADVARAYRISQNHLVKVVHQLGKAGYVSGVRGRHGGIRLARPASEINVGAVMRASESQYGADTLALLDCPNCLIAPACGLTGVVDEALAAFFAVLDRHTLADLLTDRSAALRALLASPAAERADALA